MRALLRYSYLKTMHDGSLWAFLAIPAFFGCCALIGSALSHGFAEFHYPFGFERGWAGSRSAHEMMVIETLPCALLATILSFMALRNELASQSIGSIALAVRPATIALSLVVFACLTSVVAWIFGFVTVMILTAALPTGVGLLAIKLVVGALVTGSLGALAVTISPEPPMIIGAYVSTLVFIPGFERAQLTPVLLAPVAVAIVATGISAFLMERRCAR